MTTDTTSAPASAPRERGWGRVLAALALVLSVGSALAPLDDPLLLLIAVIAGLMLAAWRQGGSGFSAIAWTALTIWSLAQAPGATRGLQAVEAAAALILGASFGTAALIRPQAAFFGRGLATVGVLLGGLALLLQGVGPGLPQVQSLVREQYAQSAQDGAEAFLRTMARQTANGRTAESEQVLTEMRAMADLWQERLPAVGSSLAPALLGLEALAVLALGWALFHRLSRTRVGPPLARLADFRFSDSLVWGLIAGLALLVTPGLAPLRGVAANLLVFFGALYAVRGIGVLWFFMTPGPLTTVLAVVIGSFFMTAVVPTAACLGLSDTWIDWRRRATAPTP
jgi:hypothetical protein